MRQLADMVREMVGSSVSLTREPLPVDDPKVRQPDITIASSVLGWSALVDLRTGLERTIRHFREVLR